MSRCSINIDHQYVFNAILNLLKKIMIFLDEYTILNLTTIKRFNIVGIIQLYIGHTCSTVVGIIAAKCKKNSY